MTFANWHPIYTKKPSLSKEELAHIVYDACQNRLLSFAQVKEQLQKTLVFKLTDKTMEKVKEYKNLGTGLSALVDIIHAELFPYSNIGLDIAVNVNSKL